VDLHAANDTIIPIILSGQRVLHNNLSLSNTYVTPSIPQGIISPQLLMQENDCSLLFHSNDVYLLPNNHVDFISNSLINDEISTKIASLDSTDNLYKVFPNNPPITCIPTAQTSTIRRYSTVNFKDLPEVVNFWHCALGHADAEVMIKFFTSNNLPIDSNQTLTSSNIRKFFPTTCPDCPLGNLQAKPAPFVPVPDETPGSTFELDYKGKWTDASGRPTKTFQGHLYTFTAVDSATGFVFSKLAKSRLSVVDKLEALRLTIANSGRVLKVIRTDNEFVTRLSKAWAKIHNIQFQPSIPYSHNTVRHIERLHRTLQEMVVKCLANKPHLNSQFWGHAYMHCVHLHNILPNRHTGISPYFQWHNANFDFKSFPLMPFGSIIMGNIPTDLQTSLSGRSKELYYVGCSELHHGAVKLFNPETKRVTLRHSFKFISDLEPTSTTCIIPEDTSKPTDQTPVMDVPIDPSREVVAPDDDEFTFHPVNKARAPSKYKFAYNFLQTSFIDKSDNVTYMIHDIVSFSTPQVKNVYCFQYYSTADFASPPQSTTDYEYEPIEEFLQDPNYTLPKTIPTRPSAKIRRLNMLSAKKAHSTLDSPMSIRQALAHPCAEEFLRAFAAEVQSLKDMHTFTEYLGDPRDIAKGSLLSSKAIFSIVYNPDGTFKKYKARLVARGVMLKNILDPDTYAGTVHSETLRLFFFFTQ
jgi:hypothetical protein